MAVHIMKSARAGLESTRGTFLTPTRLVYFDDGFHQQDIKTIRPQQVRGSYFGWVSAAPGPEMNTVEMSGAMSYDDLIWFANVHIKAVASGTGAGADKTWTFTPSASTDDVKSCSFEIGYADGLGATQPAAKLSGCLGDELSLTFDKGGDGQVQFTSKLISTSAATQVSSFDGSLTDRTLTLASASTTQTYIDATTIGTTTDSNVISVKWTLTNGYTPLYTLNNSTAPLLLARPGPRSWKAEITRYYGTAGGPNADVEWDAYIAKTVRKIRVRTLGPTLGSSNYKIDLDLYGVYTDMKNSEADGFGVQTFTLEPIYDTTATTDFSLIVVNSTASIT